MRKTGHRATHSACCFSFLKKGSSSFQEGGCDETVDNFSGGLFFGDHGTLPLPFFPAEISNPATIADPQHPKPSTAPPAYGDETPPDYLLSDQQRGGRYPEPGRQSG